MPNRSVVSGQPASTSGNDGLGAVPISFLLSIMDAIEARASYVHSRAQRVALYSVGIARALALPEEQVNLVRLGALLSNIGMLRVPEAILQKTGPLTEAEQQTVRQHPVLSVELLESVLELAGILPLVLHHHEDYAGGGYPRHLRGEQIPLGARIIRVAETYEALRNQRPYRRAYAVEEALDLLAIGAGQEFDPRLVQAFRAALRRGPVRDEILEHWEGQRAAQRWQMLGSPGASSTTRA